MWKSLLTLSFNFKINWRPVLIALLLLFFGFGLYAYQYVVLFNAQTTGYVYGESTSKGSNYKLHTLKYCYSYKDITYFDQVDYMGNNELEVGDSIELRLFTFLPQKHVIETIFRNNSSPTSYDPESRFDSRYHMHINYLSDYQAKTTDTLRTPADKQLIYPTSSSKEMIDATIKSIDAIRFNRGSLIEFYILTNTPDTIYLHPVYYYLDEYSVDGYPASVLKQQLSQHFPQKHIHISILDKKNPKHERVLKTTSL